MFGKSKDKIIEEAGAKGRQDSHFGREKKAPFSTAELITLNADKYETKAEAIRRYNSAYDKHQENKIAHKDNQKK